MMVQVEADELAALRAEVARLREREEELLGRNTELVELARSRNIQACVVQFHRAVGQPVLEYPQVPPEDRVRLRLSLIMEEFREVLEACGLHDQTYVMPLKLVTHCSSLNINLTELADALCDLDYVVEGTRLEFGIDGGPVLAEVHASNLSKLGGPKREDGKILKGPNYRPPDILGCLVRQGYRL